LVTSSPTCAETYIFQLSRNRDRSVPIAKLCSLELKLHWLRISQEKRSYM
jgi:hypothetical protein